MVWATTHIRQYLFGNSSTLVTDHEPLRLIPTTRKMTGKPARWSLFLQKYDFTVVHRAGTKSANADCLSGHSYLATHVRPFWIGIGAKTMRRQHPTLPSWQVWLPRPSSTRVWRKSRKTRSRSCRECLQTGGNTPGIQVHWVGALGGGNLSEPYLRKPQKP